MDNNTKRLIAMLSVVVIVISILAITVAIKSDFIFGASWTGDNPDDEWTCSVTGISPADGATNVRLLPKFTFTVTTDCSKWKVNVWFTRERGFIDQVTHNTEYFTYSTNTITFTPSYTDASKWTADFYQWKIKVYGEHDNLIYQTKTMKYYVGGVVQNSPPVADTGGPYYGTVGEAVYFDGSGSHDPDNNIVSYAWEKDLSTGQLYPYDDLKTKIGYVTYGQAGTYRVALRVIDKDGFYSYSETKAYISPQPDNILPVADTGFGDTLSVKSGDNIYFDGSGSYDADGVVTKYEWDLDGDGTYEREGCSHSIKYIHFMSYNVKLRVTDDDGAQDVDTVLVTVSTDYYNLTVTADPIYGGTIIIDPLLESYIKGMEVALTATASSGYVFDHWSGDATGSANPTTVIMDSDKTVTATFVEEQPDQYTLTLQSNPPEGGSVAVVSVASASQHYAGDIVTITATPNSGYSFNKWTGASGSSTTTVTMNSDMTVIAHFNKDTGIPSWRAIAGILGIIGLAGIGAVIVFKKR